MKLLKYLVVVLAFVAPLFGYIEESKIQSTMKDKIDTVILLLKDKNLAKESKLEQIFAIFDPVFDYPLMAKLSIGPKQWKMLTSEQQNKFKQHFENRLKNSYAQKLELYTDEVVAIKGLQQVKSRLHLQTELIGKEKNYEIDYKFYDAKDKGWLIYDVDILGVSIIQTYRSQFEGFLEKNSFEELIKKLDASEVAKSEK